MPTPEALVALASGVALAGLGAFLVALRPSRGESVVFGAFLLLWSGQVVTANLARVTGDGAAVHAPALLASFGLMATATALLAHLAAAHLGGRGGAALRAAGVAVAAAGALAVLLWPGLVLSASVDAPGTVRTTLGPLALPLFLAPFHAAFLAACWSAYARWRRAAPGAPRERARAVFCAFALFSSYLAVRNLAITMRMPMDLLLHGGQAGWASLPYAAGVVALLALAAHAALAQGPRMDRAMWLALAVPAASGAAEAALAPGSVLGTGAWRLAAAGTIAYAVARHQLFDFELRLKESAAGVLAAAALVAGILGALALRPAGGMAMAAPLVAGAAAAGAGVVLRDRIGDALFPRASRSPGYLRTRQLDVYRVRLEAAVARPEAGDDADLRRLRRALGVSEAEHAAMELVLRAHHSPTRSGDVVGGRYRVVRVLAEGGSGRACLARETATEQLVVVKLVRGPMEVPAREARLAARVVSPFVVRVLDEGPAPGGRFVAMEYVEGGTLADRLADAPRLAPAEAERLALGVLSGLAAAHQAGVVHGDLTPANVLLARDGTPRLADFGAARVVDAGRTRAAPFEATLLYASPEQLRGEAPTMRSDVYAAGALLHRCVAGRAHAAWDDPDPRALDDAPRLRGVVLRALSRDPAARYRDAGEMLDALLLQEDAAHVHG